MTARKVWNEFVYLVLEPLLQGVAWAMGLVVLYWIALLIYAATAS